MLYLLAVQKSDLDVEEVPVVLPVLDSGKTLIENQIPSQINSDVVTEAASTSNKATVTEPLLISVDPGMEVRIPDVCSGKNWHAVENFSRS